MKIAIISDIHGNHVALRGVLDEARRQGVGFLFVLGDIVGYYYHADSVLDLLENWSCEMIQGNHEELLRQASVDDNQAHAIKQRFGHGIDKALEQLTDTALGKLINLPSVKMIEMDGVKFQLCHGSPWDRDSYIYPDSPQELLDKCVTSAVDFVLLGHTHYPFVYCKGRTVIANIGSVGQARDKGGVASWAVIDTSNRTLTFQHTPYNITSLLAEVKKFDPDNTYLADVLLR